MADDTLRPQAGDLSVCLECAGLMVFEPGGVMRAIGAAEFDALPEETRMELYLTRVAVRAALRRMHRANFRRSDRP